MPSTSIHLFKTVSTDLTIKSDSVLTNPIGKYGVQLGQCSKTGLVNVIRYFYQDIITRRVANQS